MRYSLKFYYLSLVRFFKKLKFKEAIKLALPIFIFNLLKYFKGSEDFYYALRYAILMSIGIGLNCIIHHPYFMNMNRLAVKIRVSLSGLVYKKAFKLNMVSYDSNSGGQFINILSTDCSRVESAILFFPVLFLAPIELICVILLLIQLVDRIILSGLIVIAIAIPLQSLMGKVFDHMRRITSKKCDRRIDLLSEVFNGIKIIKMYCWEEPFKKIIEYLRK